MRICVVNINSEAGSQPALDMIAKVGEKVLRPDTRLGFKSVKTGLPKIRDYFSSYFNSLNNREVIEKFIEAEKEGYDAATVNCFEDPGVREAREILNMPIVGPSESTILFACLLGQKFGFVNLNEPRLFPKDEEIIKKHGLWDRAVVNPVRPISMTYMEAFSKGYADYTVIASAVLEKAKELVRDGANVVVVSCCGLGPPCTLAGLVKIEGVDAPILDPMAVALKMAEMLADLTQKLGLPATSRTGAFASPSSKDVQRVREHFGLERP